MEASASTCGWNDRNLFVFRSDGIFGNHRATVKIATTTVAIRWRGFGGRKVNYFSAV